MGTYTSVGSCGQPFKASLQGSSSGIRIHGGQCRIVDGHLQLLGGHTIAMKEAQPDARVGDYRSEKLHTYLVSRPDPILFLKTFAKGILVTESEIQKKIQATQNMKQPKELASQGDDDPMFVLPLPLEASLCRTALASAMPIPASLQPHPTRSASASLQSSTYRQSTYLHAPPPPSF